jgi:hypothetical protein
LRVIEPISVRYRPETLVGALAPSVWFMGMRRVLAVVAVVGVAATGLVGCSVPVGYGVRLNGDGTVDFVECTSRTFDFVVNYTKTATAGDDDPIEWEVVADDPKAVREALPVVRHGEPPDGFTTVNLQEPPEDWLYVEFAGSRAYRGDLAEGEWQWHAVSQYPWVPEHPCRGVDLDDLER